MAYVLSASNVKVGAIIGDWTVLENPILISGTVKCRCTCGRVKAVFVQNLMRGGSTRCKSCAIGSRPQKYSHGRIRSKNLERLYRIWAAMKDRCNPATQSNAKNYSGRGISVCPEWEVDFGAFRKWALANGYRGDLTLDRWPDVNGNYDPSNCRWATMRQQNRNRRNNRLITAFGETKSLAEWIEDTRCVIEGTALWSRLARGWPPQAAMETPLDIVNEIKTVLVRGDNNGNAKLDEARVKEIRSACQARTKPQWQIAADFGVAQCTVSAIHQKKLWAWLE